MPCIKILDPIARNVIPSSNTPDLHTHLPYQTLLSQAPCSSQLNFFWPSCLCLQMRCQYHLSVSFPANSIFSTTKRASPNILYLFKIDVEKFLAVHKIAFQDFKQCRSWVGTAQLVFSVDWRTMTGRLAYEVSEESIENVQQSKALPLQPAPRKQMPA